MRAIVEETRADGHRVVRAKGYTDYAVAMSAALIEKRCLCRPGSLPCRPPAVYSRRIRGCLYDGPRLGGLTSHSFRPSRRSPSW